MSRCGRCGKPFSPGDEIPITLDLVPASFRPLVPASIKAQLNRVLAHRCPEPECAGLVTVLYLPPAPLPPQGDKAGPVPAPGTAPGEKG